MHRSMVRPASWSLCLGFCAAILLTGCGEDMSQPKTEIPKETPKDLAKDSQQYYTKQLLQQKKGGAKAKR